jgi:hypothetical protein
VIVSAGGSANVKAVLEIGGISETVTVEGATAIIQTQASSASTTLSTSQILNLPVGSRNTLDFVQFLPGVQTASGVRSSTVAGLPQSSINITVDGINVQDNYLKTTDGFFARMSPRLDSVEEVTLSTASQGADSSGQGAIQIKFTTRSGTSQFDTSLYHFYQNEWFNTNTYSNRVRGLPKGTITLYQGGGRVGGPVVIPGLYDGRGKAFFFVNYEESYQPAQITTTSRLLLPSAQSGVFNYAGGTVNLWTLAATNGVLATPDPVVAKLLADIQASTASGGVFTAITGALNSQSYSFQQPSNNHNHYPTVRGDYNLSNRHRLTFSENRNYINSNPDTTNTRQPTWPGFPMTGAQISTRYQITTTLRSTLSSNLVNTLLVGGGGGPTQFSPGTNAGMFSGALANQMGYFLSISNALNNPSGNAPSIAPTNAGASSSISQREPTTRVFEDTLTWLKGSHSMSMGFAYTRLGIWVQNLNVVPTIGFGLLTGDPALAMFSNAGNFPGSSSADRNDAQALYSVLVGSVNSIAANARLDGNTGKYIYNGQSYEQGRLQQSDSYIQDNWRLRPNLSINAGVRYAVQLPFYPMNGSYSTATLQSLWGVSGYAPGCDLSHPTAATCNLFHAGTMTGTTPNFINFGKGVQAYKTDWNNVAPSIGVNWTPTPRSGLVSRLLGRQQGDTSFSGGWARAYERHGLSDFTGVFSSNPGININANRNAGNGNIGAPPLYLRNGNLGPPPFCSASATTGCLFDSPSYPLTNNVATGSVNIFDPNLQVPYADSYTASIQRALSKQTAIEVRYVGTRSRAQWTNYNYNEANILDNGFLSEFKLAQANLQASIATGCGTTANPCTFAYKGPGTGTNPLPIYLAYLTGTPLAQAGDSTKYTGTNWTNSNFINPLGVYTANPFTPAGTSSTTSLSGIPAQQANAILAGLPANFFRVNPDMLGGANATGNGGFSKYNSVQVQFRRRLANGLQFDANYVYGKGYNSTRYSFRVDRILTRATGGGGDVTHAYKMTWIYDVPFGRGKRYGTNMNVWLDGILGGWLWSGTSRIQSGPLTDLGNVRVVGMTLKDVQKAFHLRKIDNLIAYSWPQDIIDNSIKAFSTSATSPTGYSALGPPSGRYFAPTSGPDCIETIASGYGNCGVRSLVVTGPPTVNVDMSLRKNINFLKKAQFQVSLDVFNVLNKVQWSGQAGTGGTQLSSYQSSLPGSSRTMQLGTRFTW